jgi:hypothetical protein
LSVMNCCGLNLRSLHLLPLNWSSNRQVTEKLSLPSTGMARLQPHATGESRLDWRAYTKYKETGDVFLLFVSPHRYTWIPKSAMSPAQIEELRGLLRARMSHHSSPFVDIQQRTWR